MKPVLYFFIFVLLSSCTSNTIYEKPKNLIPKDSMVNLLTDMYIASSSFHEKNLDLKAKVNYTQLVYNKYKIDSLRFSTSNVYYTSKIESYQELLNEVKDNLERLQKKYSDSIKVKDSITNKNKIDRVKKMTKEQVKQEIENRKIKKD